MYHKIRTQFAVQAAHGFSRSHEREWTDVTVAEHYLVIYYSQMLCSWLDNAITASQALWEYLFFVTFFLCVSSKGAFLRFLSSVLALVLQQKNKQLLIYNRNMSFTGLARCSWSPPHSPNSRASSNFLPVELSYFHFSPMVLSPQTLHCRLTVAIVPHLFTTTSGPSVLQLKQNMLNMFTNMV